MMKEEREESWDGDESFSHMVPESYRRDAASFCLDGAMTLLPHEVWLAGIAGHFHGRYASLMIAARASTFPVMISYFSTCM